MEGIGVSSLLKDLNCGQANLEVPHFLSIPNFGARRVMVDVGLDEGKETIEAVRSGFTVFSFEPRVESVEAVAASLDAQGLDYQLVKISDTGALLEPLRPPSSDPPRGISYLFNAGAGREYAKMNISVEGAGSSFVDPKNTAFDREVPVVPIADYVKSDVYFFKTDTQGFEMEVFAGAMPLFQNHHVRMITTELFPQGLEGANSSARALVEFLTEKLQLQCFSAEPALENGRNMQAGHPEGKEAFIAALERRTAEHSDSRYGFFDDLTCISTNLGALDFVSK